MVTKVSIIVPIYNGEKYISTCLDSLANQTLDNIQVIMINDGSSDNSEQVCLRYREKYPFFEYYSKENGGSASARNVGLEHAVGEYVGFVDSDDWVEPYMFEKMYAAAKKQQADIVFNTMRKAGVSYSFTWPVPGFYNRKAMEKSIFPELLPHPTESGTFRSFDWSNCYRIFRRSLIEKNSIRYFEQSRRCEDLLFAFECSVNAISYLVMEHEPMYHYCPSDTSKSRHYTKNMWQSIRTLMEHLEEIDRAYLKADFSGKIQYCILYFCVIVLRNEVFGAPEKEQKVKVQEILDDQLCKRALSLRSSVRYNKEYTAIFNAMQTGKAAKVINVMKWYAWKKRNIAPLLSKLHR